MSNKLFNPSIDFPILLYVSFLLIAFQICFIFLIVKEYDKGIRSYLLFFFLKNIDYSYCKFSGNLNTCDFCGPDLWFVVEFHSCRIVPCCDFALWLWAYGGRHLHLWEYLEVWGWVISPERVCVFVSARHLGGITVWISFYLILHLRFSGRKSDINSGLLWTQHWC